MTDVIDLIEHDHREVESLFAKFRATQDPTIASQICDELERHADAEEKVVYSVIDSEVVDGDSLIDEAVDEHEDARRLIGRIRATDDAGEKAELLAELERAIAHHVEEEESEVLPKTRATLEPFELEEIGRRFEAAKS